MKRTILALTAMTLAAPAIAQQIPAGTDAAREYFAQSETGNEARVYIDGMGGISDEALAEAEMEIESEDGFNNGTEPMFNTDLDQYANEEARRILMQIDAEDEGNGA